MVSMSCCSGNEMNSPRGRRYRLTVFLADRACRRSAPFPRYVLEASGKTASHFDLGGPAGKETALGHSIFACIPDTSGPLAPGEYSRAEVRAPVIQIPDAPGL